MKEPKRKTNPTILLHSIYCSKRCKSYSRRCSNVEKGEQLINPFLSFNRPDLVTVCTESPCVSPLPS